MRYLILFSILFSTFCFAAHPKKQPEHIVVLECYSGKSMILYRKMNADNIRIFKDGMIGIHEKKHDTAIFAECLIID